jgi:hypothetical protein
MFIGWEGPSGIHSEAIWLKADCNVKCEMRASFDETSKDVDIRNWNVGTKNSPLMQQVPRPWGSTMKVRPGITFP